MTQHVVVNAHKVGDEVSAAHRAGLHTTRRLHANIFKWFKEENEEKNLKIMYYNQNKF